MKKIVLIVLLTIGWQYIHAQLIAPMSDEMTRFTEGQMSLSGKPFFSVWKPYFDNQMSGTARQDSLALFGNEERRRTWLGRKLFQESFLQVDSVGFYLYADPLVNLQKGKESPGSNTYINTRGFRAGVRLGRRFALGTTFYENQARFTLAENAYIDSFRVVPGQGRVHNQQTYGWDYANSSGYVSFSPIEQLNIQLGQGKNFLGDGSRSLLLSDYSYSYPYLRCTWQTKRWMYSWMLAQTDIFKTNTNDKFMFRYNLMGIHLLSVNLGSWLQATVVQENLFYHPDTLTRFKPSIDVLNPVIMPVFSKENVHSLWGLNWKAKLFAGLYVYNQWVFDNLGGKGNLHKGVQAGWKYFGSDFLRGVYFKGEYNRVEAGTYANSNGGMNWRHYNQPLAHPFGNHFEEYLVNASWQIHRWQLSGRCGYAQPLKSTNNASEYRISGIPYWENRFLLTRNFQLTYYLNTKTLLGFTAGYTLRNERVDGANANSGLVYFAFKTGLDGGSTE